MLRSRAYLIFFKPDICFDCLTDTTMSFNFLPQTLSADSYIIRLHHISTCIPISPLINAHWSILATARDKGSNSGLINPANFSVVLQLNKERENSLVNRYKVNCLFIWGLDTVYCTPLSTQHKDPCVYWGTSGVTGVVPMNRRIYHVCRKMWWTTLTNVKQHKYVIYVQRVNIIRQLFITIHAL